MMTKTAYYMQMAQEAAAQITGSKEQWTAFLTTSARLYKYPFAEQLMIYKQRPEATACAEYDLWNDRMNRYVKRGSKGIALLDMRGEQPKLRYVFDVADTGERKNSRPVQLWKMNAEHEQPIIRALDAAFDVPVGAGSLENHIMEAAERLARDYWEENRRQISDIVADSYLEGYLSRDEFYDMLRKGVDVSTSQPSPTEVMDMWKEMLKEYEEIVYIPLSSALSGSCMTAEAMANEDEFAGKVFVVDNGRVATPMHRSVLDAVEMAKEGYSVVEIKKILEETREKMTIYIGLSTLKYLKKGGRVSSVTALAADVLNIKPVMHFSTGKLDIYQKCRGMKKSRKVMIDAMKHELETNFREEYAAGKVYLMAASSSTDEVTEEWVNQIKESFPGMEVMCDKLSFGLSCHIGPDGLGIGCTCKPV